MPPPPTLLLPHAQCSKLHDIDAFDGIRRSCREALAQHQQRRNERQTLLGPGAASRRRSRSVPRPQPARQQRRQQAQPLLRSPAPPLPQQVAPAAQSLQVQVHARCFQSPFDQLMLPLGQQPHASVGQQQHESLSCRTSQHSDAQLTLGTTVSAPTLLHTGSFSTTELLPVDLRSYSPHPLSPRHSGMPSLSPLSPAAMLQMQAHSAFPDRRLSVSVTGGHPLAASPLAPTPAVPASAALLLSPQAAATAAAAQASSSCCSRAALHPFSASDDSVRRALTLLAIDNPVRLCRATLFDGCSF